MNNPRSLTPAEVGEIEVRLAKATPGPWGLAYPDITQLTDAGKGYPLNFYPDSKDIVTHGSGYDGNGGGVANDDDAAFIAHSPEDIANLIHTLRQREAEIGKMRELFTPNHRGFDGIYIIEVGEYEAALNPAEEGTPPAPKEPTR